VDLEFWPEGRGNPKVGFPARFSGHLLRELEVGAEEKGLSLRVKTKSTLDKAGSGCCIHQLLPFLPNLGKKMYISPNMGKTKVFGQHPCLALQSH